MRFSIEHHMGRLIEARVFALQTAYDAKAYAQALKEQVQKMTADAPILVADHRPVVIYPQAAADCLAELFEDMNSRLDRAALIVAPTNATLLLQIDRIVREARFEKRRVFRTEGAAIDFLESALDAGEMARARIFLAEHR
jgi:hypothetical protein